MRVARECVEDLAADGVVYAEVRFAPGAAPARRPDPRRGGRGGARRVPRGRGGGAPTRPADPSSASCSPRCGTRPGRGRSPSWRCATATTAWSASTSPAPRRASRPPGTSTRSSTCAARTPTSPSTPARRSGCRRSGRRSSGAAPTGSGHGVRIVDDIEVRDDGTVTLGRLAAYVRDKRIPLEMCPTSNVQTGAATSIAEHPIGLLHRAAVPGDRQHRQPADERHVDDAARWPRWSRRSATAGRPALVHDQRDEVGVHPLRRAAGDHRRRDQAGYAAYGSASTDRACRCGARGRMWRRTARSSGASRCPASCPAGCATCSAARTTRASSSCWSKDRCFTSSCRASRPGGPRRAPSLRRSASPGQN